MPKLRGQRVSAITYSEGASRRIYVFAIAEDGNMHVNYWNGSKWQWANQGHPAGQSLAGGSPTPSAVTYRKDNKQRIYTFVDHGNLHVNYWNGSKWQWADQGAPEMEAGVVGGPPSAITYNEAGVQKIYALAQVSSVNSHFVNYWNGSKWQWANNGKPPNAKGTLGGPEAVTYVDEIGKRRIYSFTSSGPAALAAGRLYVNYWNGSKWQWSDQGTPGTEPGRRPTVVTYKQGTKQRIYAFISNGNYDHNLFVNYWNGSIWQWADLGSPPGLAINDVARAVTYLDTTQRIYVFVPCVSSTAERRLCICYWDGASWKWSDQGAFPSSVYGSSLNAVTYPGSAGQRIYAFFVGQDRHLWTHYWNGSKWQWADQGMP